MHEVFLPGVPADLVQRALDRAGGNEIASGKFASPESSSALAVNTFGWFMQDRASSLPPFPGLYDCGWPAVSVDVERQMRFPWSGGRHPWLDAAVETETCLIGVESKRFEPFRDTKRASLSEAYDRDVWGAGMEPWCAMRDNLRAAPSAFVHLDAAQLVKHAFGLVTEGMRLGKAPVLLYLFAEPTTGRKILPEAFQRHRTEVAAFASSVAGAKVRFAACSYREWFARFQGDALLHANLVRERFNP